MRRGNSDHQVSGREKRCPTPPVMSAVGSKQVSIGAPPHTTAPAASKYVYSPAHSRGHRHLSVGRLPWIRQHSRKVKDTLANEHVRSRVCLSVCLKGRGGIERRREREMPMFCMCSGSRVQERGGTEPSTFALVYRIHVPEPIWLCLRDMRVRARVCEFIDNGSHGACGCVGRSPR